MELKCELNKVPRYKVKIQNTDCMFFHIHKNQLEHKVEAILFTKAERNIKYLIINVIKGLKNSINKTENITEQLKMM